MEQSIVCPSCGERIAISRALTQHVEAELRAKFEAEAKKKERETQVRFDKELAAASKRLEGQAMKKAQDATAADLRALRRQLGQEQQ